MTPRLLRWLALATLLFASYVMLADWMNLASVGNEAEPHPIAELPAPQPWGGYAWRELAQAAGDFWQADPDQARDTLTTATRRYPLDATQWLDRARIEAASGNTQAVEPLLAVAASIQPQARRFQWRATQIALQSGQPAAAERQLRAWIADFPNDTERALFIARRWIDTPEELIDRILPAVDGVIPDDFLLQALRTARRQQDTALAKAAWQRFDPRPGLEDSSLLEYVDLLLTEGEIDTAVATWQSVDPTFARAGIANASFDRPTGEGLALNWRTERPPAGVRIERDTETHASAPASLKVAFGGKDNIALNLPWTRVPVEPGTRYRLTGQWQADRITTRSRPLLFVQGEGGRINARLDLPEPDFDWQPFELEFDVPEDVRVARLQLRRNRTNDFDRYIDGTLWLDDLNLERIEPESPDPESPEAETDE